MKEGDDRTTTTAADWAQVVDRKIGFHKTSSAHSIFEKTELLENTIEALKAKQSETVQRMNALKHKNDSRKGASGSSSGSGGASEAEERRRLVSLCNSFQYETESACSYVRHDPLIMTRTPVTRMIRGNNKDGSEPPRAKFSKQGEFLAWVDVASAEGGLVPVVASERLGITRMKR